jgi:hypothetical protein
VREGSYLVAGNCPASKEQVVTRRREERNMPYTINAEELVAASKHTRLLTAAEFIEFLTLEEAVKSTESEVRKREAEYLAALQKPHTPELTHLRQAYSKAQEAYNAAYDAYQRTFDSYRKGSGKERGTNAVEPS